MKIWGALAILVTVIGAFLGFKGSIVANDRRKRELIDLKADNETTERMQDAEIGNDSDAAARFLRERSKSKRDL